MRLLANENIGPSIIQGLRAAGNDVLSVKESLRGATDPVVLARAVAEDRILLTFDKDFGELAFRSRLPATCGVVLIRITPKGREHDARFVLRALLGRGDWSGGFSVITNRGIRRRPLPGLTHPDST